MEELFAGRHFDREVIILCVRRYLRYKFSFRDLVEMMAERGLSLAHTTILRWVRQTIDFRLNRTRDVAAVKAFFQKAVRHEGRPQQTITLNGYAASHRAVQELRDDGILPKRTKRRSSKYLNEQDHRGITSHARFQKLCIRRQRDHRHRTSSPHTQTPVRAESAKMQRPNCAGNLECLLSA